MKLHIEIILIGIIALSISLILIPILKKLAINYGLTDIPNSRKLHKSPIPLIGGIAILLSTIMALLLSNTFWQNGGFELFIFGPGLLLLITGSIDDKIDISPLSRLIIQFGCAYTVASFGIRLTSLYGIFGIYDIPNIWQYIVTMVIITGVVNSFNLMDGIDGLAGGLAVFGLVIFSILSYFFGQNIFIIFFAATIGATLGFLKFNLSKNKIFLGDGGSLFLGFILVTSGIKLIEVTNISEAVNQTLVIIMVVGTFLIPVLDALRVFRKRIKSGVSPFTPDKNHLHHLFIFLGFTHKVTTILIISSSFILLILTLVMSIFFSITWVIIFSTLLLLSFISILILIQNVKEWSKKIREMENR